jgi:nitrogen fixation protein FixH
MTGAGKRRPGWWYPYIFVAAFGVVLAVNLVLMFSAIRTFSGLETDQAYQKGVAYNQTLALAEAQERLGWTVEAALEPRPAAGADNHGGDLAIRYLDRAGRPVTGLAVQAEFIRPTAAGHDTVVPLIEQGEGRYGRAVVLALPGQWDVRITARRETLSYQTETRVYVP